MALRLFWNCESTTFGAADFSAGDTTAAAFGTPSISSAAARNGSNGVLVPTSNDHYRFDAADIADDLMLVGAVHFSIRYAAAIPDPNQPLFAIFGAGGTGNSIQVLTALDGEFRFRIGDFDGGTIDLDTTAVAAEVDEYYSLVVRWDQPNNKRRIEVYDDNDGLIQTLEDLATAYNAPSELSGTSNLRLGFIGVVITHPGDVHFDHWMIADAYDEPIQNNLSITDVADYDDTVSSSIAGNAALAFAAAGAVSGAGSLAGQGAAAVVGTAAIAGDGALAGTVAATWAGSAALAGAGSLAATASLVLAAAGELEGLGGAALAGSADLTFTAAGTLLGTGPLAGAIAVSLTTDALAAGAGAAAGNAALSLGLIGSIAGAGSLAGSVPLVFTATLALGPATAAPGRTIEVTLAGRTIVADLGGRTISIAGASRAIH